MFTPAPPHHFSMVLTFKGKGNEETKFCQQYCMYAVVTVTVMQYIFIAGHIIIIVRQCIHPVIRTKRAVSNVCYPCFFMMLTHLNPLFIC